MYKAKLGIILPSANTVMEPEFYQMAPEGVGIFTTRVPLTTAYKRDFLKVANRVEDAAKLLSDATVDMIILGCTACSFIGGKNYDEKLAERIKKASGIRSTTTASAMVGALKELGLKKVSVATPYLDEVTEALRVFLEANGIKVLQIRGLNIPGVLEVGLQTRRAVRRLVEDVVSEEDDGLFISCTNFSSSYLIDGLEKKTGKPVVNSNQASLWYMLRQVGVTDPVEGYGSLLRKH